MGSSGTLGEILSGLVSSPNSVRIKNAASPGWVPGEDPDATGGAFSAAPAAALVRFPAITLFVTPAGQPPP